MRVAWVRYPLTVRYALCLFAGSYREGVLYIIYIYNTACARCLTQKGCTYRPPSPYDLHCALHLGHIRSFCEIHSVCSVYLVHKSIPQMCI
jgi:hypothetical protein